MKRERERKYCLSNLLQHDDLLSIIPPDSTSDKQLLQISDSLKTVETHEHCQTLFQYIFSTINNNLLFPFKKNIQLNLLKSQLEEIVKITTELEWPQFSTKHRDINFLGHQFNQFYAYQRFYTEDVYCWRDVSLKWIDKQADRVLDQIAFCVSLYSEFFHDGSFSLQDYTQVNEIIKNKEKELKFPQSADEFSDEMSFLFMAWVPNQGDRPSVQRWDYMINEAKKGWERQKVLLSPVPWHLRLVLRSKNCFAINSLMQPCGIFSFISCPHHLYETLYGESVEKEEVFKLLYCSCNDNYRPELNTLYEHIKNLLLLEPQYMLLREPQYIDHKARRCTNEVDHKPRRYTSEEEEEEENGVF